MFRSPMPFGRNLLPLRLAVRAFYRRAAEPEGGSARVALSHMRRFEAIRLGLNPSTSAAGMHLQAQSGEGGFGAGQCRHVRG